jgi:hypothetical protein
LEYTSAVSMKFCVDDADRVVVVGVADGRAEHQRAERVGADLDAGPAEGAVLHRAPPRVAVKARSAWCRCETLDVNGTLFRN